jgi:acid phosphatase family membrane protein YuiD
MRCFLRRWLRDHDKIQEGEQTMQFIKELFSVNEILTVSIVGWFVAQVLKTIINFILLGKLQLERMWGDGGMPSAHSATVCAMVIAAARSEGVSSAIFAVASVVAIITMHDAMGVRHETGEQAKVLNQMIDQWIEVSEKNAPFLQNMHLKEMVGHTPLQVVAGMVVGIVVGCLYPMHLL